MRVCLAFVVLAWACGSPPASSVSSPADVCEQSVESVRAQLVAQNSAIDPESVHLRDADGDGCAEAYARTDRWRAWDVRSLADATPDDDVRPALTVLSPRVSADEAVWLRSGWDTRAVHDPAAATHVRAGFELDVVDDAARGARTITYRHGATTLFARTFSIGGENSQYAAVRAHDPASGVVFLEAMQGYATDCTDLPRNVWRLDGARVELVAYGLTTSCGSEGVEVTSSGIAAHLADLGDLCGTPAEIAHCASPCPLQRGCAPF